MRRTLTTLPLLFLAPAPGLAQTATRIAPPPEIAQYAAEQAALCREFGNPVFLPEFLRVADLNGDGQRDYVTWDGGISCEGAPSVLGGSAGFVATVWLSEGAALRPVWESQVQDLELQGSTVVVWVHGAFCDPPRSGAEPCELRLNYQN